MAQLVIQGPTQLNGKIAIAGSKNAALPILAASILASDKVVLSNVPALRDTSTLLQILAQLNMDILLADQHTLELDARHVQSTCTDAALVTAMRASILILGPLLAKNGEAKIALPGGCAIGARPVDLHLAGLAQLGANITTDNGYIHARVAGKLQGAHIHLPKISVGATENIVMAAVLAEGETILSGAACEPEVVDLCHFLMAMGAHISGVGTSELRIQGVEALGGCAHQIISDRIEAGTFLIGAAMTGGRVVLEGFSAVHNGALLDKLQEAGADIAVTDEGIELDMRGRKPRAVSIHTAEYPGFPTDLQAQWLALNTVAEGDSIVYEGVFENRFQHVDALRAMRANVFLKGKTAHIQGVDALHGATVAATDLRASASLVLAALVAQGETFITQIEHIDRGYMYLEEKLVALGVNLQRC